ncbi:MAG: thioredoxin family protein [Gammaproteobacteria bacterium]|nr:thioredoxin family protein [Gammaproteobacteria bacterium]
MSIKVEVFASPGCDKCNQASEVMNKLAGEFGAGRIDWRKVVVVEELDYAVELGVLATPAIAIDGELLFTGLPSTHALSAVFDRRLASIKGAEN